MVRAMKIGQAVEFAGSRPHHEVATAMRRARAFVQHSLVTSYGDSEGTPVAILEAGASGLPVISTYHAGIPEIVIHERTGLLSEQADLEGMVQNMTRLAQDPQLAGRLGAAARERIEARFTMERSIGNLWRLIREAIHT
jgi:glycosyltransferase involved in cell wall biosynthesis